MKNSIRKLDSLTVLLVIILLAIIISAFTSCSKKNTPSPALEITQGNDPNFKIIKHAEKGLSAFNRKVIVFGIDIYAVAKVEDNKLLHAANLIA